VKIKTVVLLSFICTIVMMAVMMLQGAPLKINEISPRGIVSMELARTVTRATLIYQTWYPTLVDLAINNTFIDFIFILCYGSFLFSSSYLMLKKNEGFIRKINKWICAAALVAPFFDVIENLLMFRTLSGHFSKEVIASTFFFASVKFFLAALTVFFVIFSAIKQMQKREVEMVSIV
jgi:hypothetical protein